MDFIKHIFEKKISILKKYSYFFILKIQRKSIRDVDFIKNIFENKNLNFEKNVHIFFWKNIEENLFAMWIL